MTTCFRSDIKTRSQKPGADEHHEDLRQIPQPIILPASALPLHAPMLTRPFASLKIVSLSFQRVRAAFPLRIALWVLAAVVATCVALWSFVPLQHGLLLTLIAAWFTLPGVVFAFFVYERKPGSGLAAAFVGPVWGYGASSIVLLALWTAGVRGPALLIAPLLAGAILAACAVPLRGTLAPPAFRAADVVAVCLLIILTAGIVARPFSRVAATLPDGGKAYRAYFTADFIWRMAVAAELAKGDVPPANPFYRNDYLHYYWLAHLLPAAEYREMRGVVSLEQILLANSVALDVTFVMFLYGFCRQWVRSPVALTAACTATLLCSSFEGTERLYYLWRDGGPLDSLRMQNIDAMTRWIYRSLPVDGLHRVLWYQPHHATGYALGLSAMLVIVQARRPEKARVFALSGTLLAFCLMLSTFSVIMLSAVASLVALIVLVPRRAWRALLPAAIAAAIPLALATAAAMALGYVDRDSSGLVQILVNPMAVTEPVWAIFLSFGPLLLLSILGAVFAVWHRATELLTVLRDHRGVVRVLFLRRPARPPVRLRRLACGTPAVRGVHHPDGVRPAGDRPRHYGAARSGGGAFRRARRGGGADLRDRPLQHAGHRQSGPLARGLSLDDGAGTRGAGGARLDQALDAADGDRAGGADGAWAGVLGLHPGVRRATHGGGPANRDGAGREVRDGEP